jgi:hypothetical protein
MTSQLNSQPPSNSVKNLARIRALFNRLAALWSTLEVGRVTAVTDSGRLPFVVPWSE